MRSLTSVQNMNHKDLQEKCKMMYVNLHISTYLSLQISEFERRIDGRAIWSCYEKCSGSHLQFVCSLNINHKQTNWVWRPKRRNRLANMQFPISNYSKTFKILMSFLKLSAMKCIGVINERWSTVGQVRVLFYVKVVFKLQSQWGKWRWR